MIEFKGKVAVVTGAGSGIGRAIAKRCASEGMKVVLADVNMEALLETEKELQDSETISVITDVANEESIHTLAIKTLEAFKEVNLLFNNAGVATGKTLLDSTINDWKWVMDVNFWSIVYAINVFVPIMLKQKNECYIVNTASQAGFETATDNAPYRVSKHAVAALSESLYYDMKVMNSNIGVSVLCPGFTRTHIFEPITKRPDKYNDQNIINTVSQRLIDAARRGVDPQEVANHLFEGISKEQFYILIDPSYKQNISQRMEDVLALRNPTPKLLIENLKQVNR
jgi:NADP-dependent 3-hydroxy acid dehydrogenase YdfG